MIERLANVADVLGRRDNDQGHVRLERPHGADALESRPTRYVQIHEALATSTDLSIRQIQSKIAGQASRGIVGEITKRARAIQPLAL